jgi:GAF domain-containing protein
MSPSATVFRTGVAVAQVNTVRDFEQFQAILSTRGVRDALAYLVGLTDYRFIGIWRFQDGKANAAVHFDKENTGTLRAQEVADTATYCCYVRDSKGVFKTAHALLDSRTEGHPAREVVPTYCGVPVMDSSGLLMGTLCHYDLVPRDPEQINLELMFAVASTLAQGGHVPPYPSAH